MQPTPVVLRPCSAPQTDRRTLQALSDNADKGYMRGMKTLEINPRHPLVERLREKACACCGSSAATGSSVALCFCTCLAQTHGSAAEAPAAVALAPRLAQGAAGRSLAAIRAGACSSACCQSSQPGPGLPPRYVTASSPRAGG